MCYRGEAQREKIGFLIFEIFRALWVYRNCNSVCEVLALASLSSAVSSRYSLRVDYHWATEYSDCT